MRSQVKILILEGLLLSSSESLCLSQQGARLPSSLPGLLLALMASVTSGL